MLRSRLLLAARALPRRLDSTLRFGNWCDLSYACLPLRHIGPCAFSPRTGCVCLELFLSSSRATSCPCFRSPGSGEAPVFVQMGWGQATIVAVYLCWSMRHRKACGATFYAPLLGNPQTSSNSSIVLQELPCRRAECFRKRTTGVQACVRDDSGRLRGKVGCSYGLACSATPPTFELV
jgi:hypothetical protein